MAVRTSVFSCWKRSRTTHLCWGGDSEVVRGKNKTPHVSRVDSCSALFLAVQPGSRVQACSPHAVWATLRGVINLSAYSPSISIQVLLTRNSIFSGALVCKIQIFQVGIRLMLTNNLHIPSDEEVLRFYITIPVLFKKWFGTFASQPSSVCRLCSAYESNLKPRPDHVTA